MLFDVNAKRKETLHAGFLKGLNVKTDSAKIHALCAYNKISDVFGNIDDIKTMYYFNYCCCPPQDLIRYLLKQTGNADVTCFSWSISRDGITPLIRLRQEGVITNLKFLINYDLKKFSIEAYNILAKHCDKIKKMQLHAKGFLISNDKYKITLISSGNYSSNPRLEAGVLTTDKEVHAHCEDIINLAFERGDDCFVEDLRKEQPTKPNDIKANRDLYLFRGISGSGKTTIATKLCDVVYSNDDYFGGKITKERMPDAITNCFWKVKQAMEDNVAKIGVANHFVIAKDLEKYYYIAKVYGYNVHSLICENRHNGKPNLEAHEIKSMINKMEIKLC